MSIEVLLLPLGVVAASSAAAATRRPRQSKAVSVPLASRDACLECKATRISSSQVLREVLPRIGARTTSFTETKVTANSSWGSLTFQKTGGIWVGRVDKAPEATTDEMLLALDTALGRAMQTRTAAQVVQRAEELGFRLVAQSEQDGELNYVFEEV